MDPTLSLEDLIRQNVSLSPRPNGRGFYTVLCKICGDHGRKGKRAGFTFQDNGVGYHCFNCSHKASYVPNESATMPEPMVVVLDAYQIDQDLWKQVLFNSIGQSHLGKSRTKSINIEPDPLVFPPFFYPLTDDSTDEWAQCAIDYLTSRGVNWKSHNFQLVKLDKSRRDNKQWYGRLIIPVTKDNKIVFWQGRDLTNVHERKYLSPSCDKTKIISNYNELTKNCNDPIYVSEGWFDVYHLNGIALFGNRITEAQGRWLSQSYRHKVIIPDRFGDGDLLAKDALSRGWSISLPDIGSCKDVNESIQRYGELYTRMTIRENTYSGFEASVRLGVYCESTTSKKTDKATS